MGSPRCPAGAVVAGAECTVQCPEGMVPVVGATFRMGSLDGDADERPVREVVITSFCIDTTEVTVDAYRACVAAQACSPPQTDDLDNTFRPSRRGFPDRARHPINGVSWEDARAYCAWRGRRLPTEAEWEYAARGTDGRTFPWGDDRPARYSNGGPWPECASPPGFEDCVGPVGSQPLAASPFGAQDMAGSVWEWTSDWYGPYGASQARDPAGPASGAHRVLRGGSAGRFQDRRAANRSHGPPTSRSLAVGFRCARSSEPATESRSR
ncbi:MAG: formylglycine-generating enzyme family protein [Sandaracinaceae bacterium]|nr:formylglycine-generating enzyme family protein [Sandaracinaceae bacterium]